MHWNKNEPGINTELLLLLQEKLSHITIRGLRQFIMMYDGMTIKDGVYYDRFSGALQGLEDIGDLISFTRVQFGGQPQVRIAKECMQFMITSISPLPIKNEDTGKMETAHIRLPFAYYLVSTTDSGLIQTMIDTCVVALYSIRVGEGYYPMRFSIF